MNHYLHITDPHGERRVPIVGTLAVGRDPACELYDPDPLLSRRHAEFLLSARGAIVRDLDSRNGIQVNGAAVKEALLRSGDVVQIAHMRIRYEQALAEPSAAPASEEDDRTIAIPDPGAYSAPVPAPAAPHGGGDETRVVVPNLAPAQPVAAPPRAAAPPPSPPARIAQAPAAPPPRTPKAADVAAAAASAASHAASQAAQTPATAVPRNARGPWLIGVLIYTTAVAIGAFLLGSLPALSWHDSQVGAASEERAAMFANWAAAEARARLDTRRAPADALDTITRQPGVVGALLLTPDGRVLAPSSRIQQRVNALDGLGVAPSDLFAPQRGRSGDLTVAARPVESGGDPRAAIVWVAIRGSDLGPQVGSSGALLAPMFVIAILLGIGVGALLHRGATRALSALNDDAELAMGGQLQVVGDPLGSSPTRELAGTLNYLLARVRAGGAEVERPTATPRVAPAPPPRAAATASPVPAAQRPPAYAAQGPVVAAAAARPAAPAMATVAAPIPAQPTAPPAPAAPVVPALPPARLVANAQLRVTEASDGCEAIFGVPKARAIGQHVLDAIAERGVLDALLKCLSAIPASGEYETTATHAATGRTVRLRLSRAGRDQPLTIEASQEA